MKDSFEIASLSREDLREFYDEEVIRSFSDEDMAWIARKMGDVFMDNLYWEALRDLADTVLERKGENL